MSEAFFIQLPSIQNILKAYFRDDVVG